MRTSIQIWPHDDDDIDDLVEGHAAYHLRTLGYRLYRARQAQALWHVGNMRVLIWINPN